jgi:hypothetical protein
VSINARVVLLVEDDVTLYTMGTYVFNEKLDYHIQNFDEPSGVRSHFFFLEILRDQCRLM